MGLYLAGNKLIVISGALGVAAASGNSPLTRNEHPRLMISSDNIAERAAAVSTGGEWATEYQDWVTYLDSQYSSAASAAEGLRDQYASDFALLAVLRDHTTGVTYGKTRSEYASKAIAMMLAYITAHSSATEDNYGPWSPMFVYDWLYNDLSSGERSTLVTYFKTIDSSNFANGTYQSPQESQTVSARIKKLLMMMACYADGVDDAWANDYQTHYDNLIADIWTAWNNHAGTTPAMPGQGISYGTSYSMGPLIKGLESWRVANNIANDTFYSGMTFFQKFPAALALHELPYSNADASYPGGRKYVVYKTNSSDANKKFFQMAVNMPFYTKAFYSLDPDMAALATWWRTNRSGTSITSGTNWSETSAVYGGFFEFLCGRKITGQSPSDISLPLDVDLDEGRALMRSAWADNTATLMSYGYPAEISGIRTMIRNDALALTLDRGGPLIVPGGVSVHDYGELPWFQSGLLFPDMSITSVPSDETGDYGKNDRGGMRTQGDINRLTSKRTLMASGVRDVNYILADVTRGYNSDEANDGTAYNTVKVSKVVGECVVFKRSGSGSDFIVLHDYAVTKDVKYEKYRQFVLAAEPTIDGSSASGPSRGGSSHGKTTYTGATVIQVSNTTHGNGRAFITPLLPTAFEVIKVGGPNASGTSWTTNSHEFEDVYGVQAAVTNPSPSSDDLPYCGAWRAEVWPTTKQLTDNLLHVIEANTTSQSTATATATVNGSGFIGVRISNTHAVIFSDNNTDKTSGTFVLPTAGTYKVHISRLSGSSRTVTGGANVSSITAVEGGGSSPFTVSSANTLYLTIVVGSDGTGAANTITIS